MDINQYATDIKVSTGCVVVVMPPVEYSSSKALVIYLDNDGKCSNKNHSTIEVRVYFSLLINRGYAIYCLDRKFGYGIPYGVLLRLEMLPDGVRKFLDIIRESLGRQNLVEITESQYMEMAPNKFTELDGTPATVFEAYFAELI
jgi:hypothetical protein